MARTLAALKIPPAAPDDVDQLVDTALDYTVALRAAIQEMSANIQAHLARTHAKRNPDGTYVDKWAIRHRVRQLTRDLAWASTDLAHCTGRLSRFRHRHASQASLPVDVTRPREDAQPELAGPQ